MVIFDSKVYSPVSKDFYLRIIHCQLQIGQISIFLCTESRKKKFTPKYKFRVYATPFKFQLCIKIVVFWFILEIPSRKIFCVRDITEKLPRKNPNFIFMIKLMLKYESCCRLHDFKHFWGLSPTLQSPWGSYNPKFSYFVSLWS